MKNNKFSNRHLQLLIVLIIGIPFFCHAQVGIGTTAPHASAILDLSSTSKGLLIPRLSTIQRNSIVSPATGLTIFNLDDGCTDIYDGTNWAKNCPMIQTGIGDSTGTNIWVRKADFANGLKRSSAVGFSIGTKGYIGTGDSPNATYSNDFWEYNPANNTWTQKANFGGVGRSEAVGFGIGTKGYIGTGYTNGTTYLNDFWEYNPATNIWTQKNNLGGVARKSAVGFEANGKGYIGTGKSSSDDLNDFWEFDPNFGTWTQKANVPGERIDAIGFGIGAKGYVGSGYYLPPILPIGASGGTYNDFYEYNTITNNWIAKPDLPGAPRTGAVAFSMNGKGYFGTGHNSYGYLSDFWEFTPSTNSWVEKAAYGGSVRSDAVGFAINELGYIGTGYSPGFGSQSDFWSYTVTINAPSYAQPIPSGGFAAISNGNWTLSNNQLFNNNTGNIGIGTNTPHPSAKLHIHSTNGGLLIPRMTSVQRDNIFLPASGLLIFDQSKKDFRFYNNGWNTFFKNPIGIDSFNMAIGIGTLYEVSTGGANNGGGNTAVGNYSLYENTSGYENTALGVGAGYYSTTGHTNTFLGRSTGNSSTPTFSNMTALGYSAKPTDQNTIRLGNSYITDVEAFAPYTDLSDGRYKLNVQANVPGLDFIRRLRPVTYHLDVNSIAEHLKEDYMPDNNGRMVKVEPDSFTIASRKQKSEVLNTGFIAQEVESAAQDIGYDFFGVKKPSNEESFYGLRYAQFTVPIVKAIQELDTQNKAIEAHNTALENQNKAISAAIEQLASALNAQSNALEKQQTTLNQIKLLLETHATDTKTNSTH